jgi:hypothetical protein
MSKAIITANVHLEYLDEPVEASLTFLNREDFPNTIIIKVDGITFFVTREQAEQVMSNLTVGLKDLDFQQEVAV